MRKLANTVVFILALASSCSAFAPNVGRSVHQGQVSLKQVKKTTALLSTLPLQNVGSSRISKLNNYFSSLSFNLRTDEVTQWRAAALTFVSSILFFRSAIDVQLARLWTHLMTSSSPAGLMFRAEGWEWILAVCAFFVWIHGFWWADRSVKVAAEQGRAHPWRKYRLQDRYEADKQRRMIQRRLEEPEKSLTLDEGADVAVKQSPWNWKGYVFELWVYVLPLLTWDLLSPRRHRRLAPFSAPTTLQIMSDVTVSLLMYDILFFCGHFMLHKIPFIYRTFHAKHHEVLEARAGDVVRLSLVEEVLEVGFSIVALNLLGAHPISRSIYNIIITFLLTELHCGFDFPWTPQNVIPFGFATGSRRHHYHHRTGKHYYQKFFCHVDRLFGFVQKNDGSLNGDSVQRSAYVPNSWK